MVLAFLFITGLKLKSEKINCTDENDSYVCVKMASFLNHCQLCSSLEWNGILYKTFPEEHVFLSHVKALKLVTHVRIYWHSCISSALPKTVYI